MPMIVVCIDNNFRERLARLTHVYFQRVLRARRKKGAAPRRVLRVYRLSSTLSTNLGNAM